MKNSITKFRKLVTAGLIGMSLAMLAMTVIPSSARADGFRSYRVCGGDQFSTCAAVSINVVGSNVTVRLWNLSGNTVGSWGKSTWAGTVFNGIGFYNTGNVTAVLGSLNVSGPALAGTDPKSWKLSNDSKVNFGVNFRVNTPGNREMENGVVSGCAASYPVGMGLFSNPCTQVGSNANDWVTFTFKITGNWNPNNSDIVLRGLNGPTGMGDGTVECWTADAPYGAPANCTTITPEPITMTLLATGLAGMGGVGAFKRRKQKIAA